MDTRRRKTVEKTDVAPLIIQAESLAKNGKLAEAIERYKQIVGLAPENAQAHADLAHCLLEHGEVDDAFHHIELAIGADTLPPSAQILTDLGRISASRGLLRRATEAYREALRLDPTFRPASHGLIVVTEQMN